MDIVDEFNDYRSKMNDRIMGADNKVIKRIFNLDTNAFADGALDSKTKELLGLVSSMVLRCDDCIKYHLGKCFEMGYNDEQIFETFAIANLVGGTIVIPHLRGPQNTGIVLKIMLKRDLETDRKWQELRLKLQNALGKRPKDLNAILFLIGVQELGKGAKNFDKEEKQDLLHIAICKVLSLSGFYELEGIDEDGWPHWKPKKSLPHFDLLEQEKLLKTHVIEYFEKETSIFSN